MKKVVVAVTAILVLIFGYVLISGSPAEEDRAPEPAGFSIGMNLSSVTYYTRELPFVDIMKSSMPWVTQNVQDVPGGKNPWDSGHIRSVPLDADGYPLSLPVEIPGTEAPQITATLMCRAIEGRYPKGRYVCLYDGQGEIRFFFDAKAVSSSPGRIELDVTPTHAGILMKIVRSEKGDHIRNIRVIMPGFEDSYALEPFNPVFLERLKPFKVIRFMDWQRTNDSVVQQWAKRTKPSSYTQADRGGVAIEHLVDLCNRIGADPWFCIPHQAGPDYIRGFAALVNGSLGQDRKVYIEYSNEVWNAMFGQYRWVEANGAPELSHARKYASFALKAFDIWRDEFRNPKGRVIRVVSGQQVRPGIAEDAARHLGKGGFDVLASSGYFGIGAEGYKALATLGARATAHDVVLSVYENMRTHELPAMEKHAKIASEYGVRYVTYEAGQAICPFPLGSSPPYLKALWDAQKSPELYSIYREFIASCREMDLSLFMAFAYVSAQETKSGSWGHLEYLDQPTAEALKFRVLLDELDVEYLKAGSPKEPLSK